ncbi:tRNA pseudouridine(38-40) synthase TruA [Nitratireductor basaltis]|uniref:tRNA pseudouridine synthase A n=1 Tax=Nitratireductor basaltis TaxID=472175 RepID=A0A084UDC0_9HYPH|nr:tRNA pseudouridine(38-40) synthase TruA [Nitratireductor basaltis]KFB10956.1 tRNA pseudouridine synthase A [Nitratireductor basaltis]
MARYRIDVEYDGTPYSGWQRQANQHTVQAAIEQAIRKFCGEEITLKAAGRTDAGVHATGQVSHFDLSKDWAANTVGNAINAHLALADERVAILNCTQVGEEFDSRFSAKARHYLYRIINRRAPIAIERGRAWHISRALDVDAMHEASQRLLGTHDFTTFRAAQCQAKSPVKTLDRLDVSRDGVVIEVRASARSFLHNQVRSLVGSLVKVGDGSWNADDLVAALEAKKRSACGPVAPADGLYLIQVDY